MQLKVSSDLPPIFNLMRPSVEEYRVFRQTLLASSEFQTTLAHRAERHRWSGRDISREQGVSSAFGQKRELISAFRELVASRIDTFCAPGSANARAARRALGIPLHLPVQISRRRRILLFAMRGGFAMKMLRSGVHRLAVIRTFEGRALVYRRFVAPGLVHDPYYDAVLDCLLRYFELPTRYKVFDALQVFDIRTVRNALCLGIRSQDDLLATFDRQRRLFPPALLSALIRHRVIQHLTELVWLKPYRFADSDIKHCSEAYHVGRVVTLIRRLIAEGVSRQRSLVVLQNWWACDAQKLKQALDILKARIVVNVPALLEDAGNLMWTSNAENWAYLVDVLDAREPACWRQFERMLAASRLPSAQTINAIRSLGATRDDLVILQDLLLDALSRGRDPAPGMRLLCSSPHALSFTQIANCGQYLTRGNEQGLAGFLATLDRHGFSAATAVLVFQRVFVRLGPDELERILRLYRGCRDAATDPALIAAWIDTVHPSRIDALEYLAASLNVPDLVTLQGVRGLARISTAALRYAVEARHLRTPHALRRWATQPGVEQITHVDWTDAIDRMLLDDAWERANYEFVQDNHAAVSTAISSHIRSSLGRPPDYDDLPARAFYDRNEAQLHGSLRKRILDEIPEQLDATGGILLASLIRSRLAGDTNYSRDIVAFSDILESLIQGRGPGSAKPSHLEQEVAAFVYRVSAGELMTLWERVSGFEHHPRSLSLRDYYPMTWRRQAAEAKRPLDRTAFGPLRNAFEYASRFAGRKSMFDACQKLSPKQLEHPAASLQTYVRHLGVTLSVVPAARRDELFGCLDMLEKETSTVAAQYEAIKRLAGFFAVDLVDAVRAHGDAFAASLSRADAADLTSRLGGNTSSGRPGADDSADDVCANLVATLTKAAIHASKIYGKWASTEERQAFSVGAADGGLTISHYRAVVSKHPAAFFARNAAGICSAGRVAMWREDRHSHLVVFDQVSKRFVGMAMLYVQRFPAIDRNRKTLVMRAINPTEQATATHDPGSIVEAFRNVAIQIAETNDLAAVAFPSDAGQHFLSNRPSILSKIKERYANAAKNVSSPSWRYGLAEDATEKPTTPYRLRLGDQDRFYGYEEGQGAVDELYIVWQAGPVRGSSAAAQSASIASGWSG
ncbi:UNVERIFIED_ORG: hypothetical protein ABIC62_005731 [Burkholderia sp. 1595]|uniref:Uncharacterized protein n=1 Tax=Paraburkholderia terricola TaxID=169427 RepID=A0ABU1LZK3_9BURK|nr:hypothetical protein [Paraburkholderia terricola]MDR6412193.1 hypothetical protein [Paraburkholderia terricola]